MEKLEFKTKSEIIYFELKQSIISGKYKPGQRIIISELVIIFDISASPVREAIKNLESDGLVENVPHKGISVTAIDIDDMEKIYPIRAELEGLAAEEAAMRIRKDDLKRLEELIAAMGKVISKEQFDKFGTLNRDFHMLITKACENEYLCKYIFELWNLCFRSPSIFTLLPDIVHAVHDDHQNILKALKSRDTISVRKITLSHKRRALDNMRKYYKSISLQK